MRIASAGLGLAALAFCGAAHAQVECYASEYDEKVGDVTATYELDNAGKITSQSLSWTPERTDGKESDSFARPNMMLDYKINEAGALEGPESAQVLVSRFQARNGKAQSLSEMQVKVAAEGAEPLQYGWDSQSRGQQMIAKTIRDTKPAKLTIDLLTKDGKLESSAVFDLSPTDKVAGMATKAKAAADKRVAAFQAAASGGTAPKACPAS